MRGVVLAGGLGSRLYPLTFATSKQLLPVFDKPLIYYPVANLIELGIIDITIVSDSRSLLTFRDLLGDGDDFGVCFTYKVQEAPLGISHGLLQARNNSEEDVVLILGDNIFIGAISQILDNELNKSPNFITSIPSSHPEDFGVAVFDEQDELIDLLEKPLQPESNWIVPGLYKYNSEVFEKISKMKPSERGEFEITDLNRELLISNNLVCMKLDKSVTWFDCGSHKDLLMAANFIQQVQEENNSLYGSPHLEAARRGVDISKASYFSSKSSYFINLRKLLID